MLSYPTERIALYIDGANLYGMAKGLGFDIDYKKLLEVFARKGILIRAFYYTAVGSDDSEFSPLRPLVDWLAFNGYSVVTKALREFTDSQGRKRVKGDMDMEIAVDMLDLAPSIDHAVLVSGDGDFRRLAESMQRQGKRITVISTIKKIGRAHV